ncbi:PAS domain S-box protein, partial [bacterium]
MVLAWPRTMSSDFLASQSAPGSSSHDPHADLAGALDQGYCVAEVLLDGEGKPLDYRFVYVNHLFEAFTGIPPRDALSDKTARELVPGLEDIWVERYGRVALTGEAERFEAGSERMGRWFEVRAFRFGGDESRRIGILFAEVTEKRKARLALIQSEARYRALATASSDVAYGMSPDWSVMLPLDGRGLVASNAEPIRDWLGKNIPPSEHARIREGIAKAIETKSLFEIEHRVTRPDGSLGWTRSRAVPILNDGGEILEWFGAASDITDRKRAEAAVRASEKRYRDLFESMDEGYCIIEVLFAPSDPSRAIDYRFLEINPAFEAQSGMRDVIGRRMLEFVPSIEPHWLGNYGRVALTGEPIRFIGEYTGLNRWFEVYAFRVGEASAHHVAVLFTDITSRKQAEASLRESEARFRAMADHAPMMVWVTEADGSCTYLSQSWYEFTGQTPETGLGYGWVQAVHPDDMERAEREFVQADRERRTFQVEYRLRRVDGQYRWAIDSARPRFGPTGEYLGYVGSVIDITERKESEEVLRQSEERFRIMTDAVPQIVWIVGADGRAEYFNRQWYEYTGTSSAPSTSRGVAEVYVHPDDVEATMDRFEESARAGTGFLVEHRILSAAGEYHWFLVRAEPYRDPETGAIVRWYGSSTDIHDSKLKDEALRQANESLEARVE